MRRWLIRFVSGRTEAIDGVALVEDRTLVKIYTSGEASHPKQPVTFPLVNVESYRELNPETPGHTHVWIDATDTGSRHRMYLCKWCPAERWDR